jgi:uncharacterized membrane protein
VRLAARAIDGAANEALIEFLASHYRVPKRSVRILSGLKSRQNACRSMADEKNLKTLATVVYALQAIGFLVGITWVAAVIIDYVKLDEAKGSWLESHLRWQIRTFWWGLLWSVIGTVLLLVLVGWLVLAAVLIWAIYRIVKGWLYLNDGKPIT